MGGGVVVVRFLVDSIWTPSVVDRFGGDLRGLADRLERRAGVVLDFTGVEAIVSTGLGWVIRFFKWVRVERGGDVVFCGLGPWLSEVFRLPGPAPWVIYPGRDEAVAALRTSSAARPAPPGGRTSAP
ncbi:hypothetical protein ElP_43880 [Tautonia plasticadhaerens]|uniref:STAS domain-containing protein n=2 Tax=Tautonia plasticadhaerens TaxID=2527974 RepID=A0A518H6I4_9BACT|nr:hypothetical protein ElP_43880 [Tautonia plasticadhaerens]